MEWILFWLIFAIVVGVIAGSRGRSGFGWFLLSCLISPLLGLILVLALGTPPTAAAVDPDRPTPETHVRCPDCRELVRYDAVKCKHCGARLVPQPPPATSAAPQQTLSAADAEYHRQANAMVVVRLLAGAVFLFGLAAVVVPLGSGPAGGVLAMVVGAFLWWAGGRRRS